MQNRHRPASTHTAATSCSHAATRYVSFEQGVKPSTPLLSPSHQTLARCINFRHTVGFRQALLKRGQSLRRIAVTRN